MAQQSAARFFCPRKPAPVQVTLARDTPAGTGLRTIDYRLPPAIPHLDPPGADESLYSEQTVRLPHSFWCYDPLDCGDLPVNSLARSQRTASSPSAA